MKRFRYLLFPALALIVMAISMVAIPSGNQTTVEAPTPVPHFRTTDIRIEITEDARVSRNQDPVWVQLESGEIPADVAHLTVLTDENCMPDAEGVSHCLNRVQFETASGIQEAALRHHHKMAEEPCLAPGQTLEIVR